MDDLGQFLAAESVRPVLVDIGSSGYRHKIWDAISKQSKIIGFDPDSRHFDPMFSKAFHDALLVSKAVTDNDDDDEVEFILTQYPSCSSILEGDIEALEPFMFRDYFREERRAKAPATSLNRVIDEHDLEALDWIKIDAQGFDLALVKSLSPENAKAVAAIDVEPGFIDAYKGEALFPETHDYLTQNGFWLSDLQYQAYPRVTPEQWAEIEAFAKRNDIDEKSIIRKLKGAPTAAEARYLRDLKWMAANAADNARMWKVLFAFALLDGHAGFGFDIAAAYRRQFGDDETAARMTQLAENALETALRA